ncbi:3-hydroxyacyl-CoA dehydrogenase NAD-binding domain-containing protein [candidate division KSB1 bacterium]
MKNNKNNFVIGILGTGTMGAGIAQLAASNGHIVIAFDSEIGALKDARSAVKNNLDRQIKKGKIEPNSADEILNRISFSSSLSAFNQCGLVIEAVPEDLEIKQRLYNKTELIVSEDCILATNTSSLSIASIASVCKIPGRVIGIHFFNPAVVMPLVEIIPAMVTDDDTVKTARELIGKWGKTAVIAKDTPGFIVNRIARPFYGEALRIYEEGLADIATIDYAMKEIGGFRMGPFELMDFIGNDISYRTTETIFSQFYYDPRYKPSLYQKRLVESKMLGRKTGKGFYDYNPGAAKPVPDKKKAPAERIFFRILAMLINEAADALFFNIASKKDIDLAMTTGVNYPKGLLKWADEIGIDDVLKMLEYLHSEYGEDRYRASPLLKKMGRNEERFYI